jgi:hypothetical protein
MGYVTISKEASLAIHGPIYELIDEHEGAWSEMLSQRADGTYRDDLINTSLFQDIYVREVVDFMWGNSMSSAVPWKKYHLLTMQSSVEKIV